MYHFELKPALRHPISQMEKEMERMFESFGKGSGFTPACEIRDEEKFYSVGLDIPGLRKEELAIEVKDNQLHITGDVQKDGMGSFQESLLCHKM
ncbi:MAG: Hsp20 family protein [Bacteriovoracaceae bacterium]|nr:Hsp20 family protein [Bacteriovoracaceae bacterium]